MADGPCRRPDNAGYPLFGCRWRINGETACHSVVWRRTWPMEKTSSALTHRRSGWFGHANVTGGGERGELARPDTQIDRITTITTVCIHGFLFPITWNFICSLKYCQDINTALLTSTDLKALWGAHHLRLSGRHLIREANVVTNAYDIYNK
jgi:hypothetical protein